MKCFVIAMESEASPVLLNMQIEDERLIHGKHVVRGKLYGRDTAVIICGVGKVNAACGAQIAIDLLEADTVINIGVAGGLNGGVNVGEIYGISKVVQYDFDLTQLNGTKIGTLDECEENYIPLKTTMAYPLKKLATGDRFNDSEIDFKLLTKELEADIRDMEGGAIAQVCMHSHVDFYSFKAISDLAKHGSTTEQFTANLRLCKAKLAEELKKIVEAVFK